MFEMSAAGEGLTQIAKTLNAEKVPPPRAGTSGWAPTAIREMLYRPLYRGVSVWNQTQKTHRGGTKRQIARPREERIEVPAPGLRISRTSYGPQPRLRWRTDGIHSRGDRLALWH
jgi:site-specific DNA recombinase